MDNKNDWRQTVVSQHQMFAAIAGFTITGLIILVSLGGINSCVQKFISNIILVLLILQIALLLFIAEIERRGAFRENELLNKIENPLRLLLNLISFFSWTLIVVLLIMLGGK
jgi:Na+/melibiose symporter-like transporter